MIVLDSSNLYAIPIHGLPIIIQGENSKSFYEVFSNRFHADPHLKFEQGDILAISHTFLGKIFGFFRSLKNVSISPLATKLAPICEKDPALIQLILDESRDILRIGPITITENKAGIIGANAGVDKSNIADSMTYLYHPSIWGQIVEQIGKDVEKIVGFKIPILITDSVGRPFRIGSVGLAVESWGLHAWEDLRGKSDLYGYILKHKELAVADSLAALADLVMGNADEGIPMVIIRGWKPLYPEKVPIPASQLQRPHEIDLFRTRDWDNLPEHLQLLLKERLDKRKC